MSLRECPLILALVLFGTLLVFVLPVAQCLGIVPEKTFTGQTNAIGIAASTHSSNQCAYVIFHDEILFNCPGAGTQVIVDHISLDGRKILRWAKTADVDDRLYFVAGYPTDPPNYGNLYICGGSNLVEITNYNVTISSHGSYPHLNNDIIVADGGQLVIFLGENPTDTVEYGLIVLRNGTRFGNYVTSPPPAGAMTNPFFVLDGADTIYFRAFFNVVPQMYSFKATTQILTPLSPDTDLFANGIEYIGPVAVASYPASVVFVENGLPGPRYAVCNFNTSAPAGMTCNPTPTPLERNVTFDFKAIVAVSDTIYIFANQTVFQPREARFASVPGLSQVYHDGKPSSYAYVLNNTQSTSELPTIMQVDSVGLFKVAAASSYAFAADSVGSELFVSQLNSRVRISRYSPGSGITESNSTQCSASGSRFNLPGIHAAPLVNGNIALVSVTNRGVLMRHFNSTSAGLSNTAYLRPIPNFSQHDAGLPTSVSLFRKISDAQFLLGAGVLHLPGGQPATIYASMGFNQSFISNGTNCNNALLKIEHFTLLSDGSSAVFTTLNESDPSVLELWWIRFALEPENNVLKRLDGSYPRGTNELFLKDTDLTDGRAIPLAFDVNQQRISIIARSGPSPLTAATAYNFVDGDYTVSSSSSYVGNNENIFAAPVKGGVLAVANDQGNVTFYTGSETRTGIPCGSCAIVPVRNLAVFYKIEVYNTEVFAVSPDTGAEVNRTYATPARFFMAHNAAVPGRPYFVVITRYVGWYVELWKADASELAKQLEAVMFADAQPIICGTFAYGAVLYMPTSSSVQYLYFSFITGVLSPIETFYVAPDETWCNSAVPEKRVMINSADKIILVDMASTVDPAPYRVFPVPRGTTLVQQVDIYRDQVSGTPRLIATSLDVNRDAIRISNVVTMPFDFCLVDADCLDAFTPSCVNSACVSASPPQQVAGPLNGALSPSTLIGQPQGGSAPIGPPSQQPIVAPVSGSGCVGQPPVQGATCVGSTWVIQGNVNVTGNGQVVIGSNTVINGTFVVSGSNASVVIAPGATLQVTECAQFDGTLVVNTNTPTATVLNSTLTVINFGGYCGGIPTTFTATSLRLSSNESCAKFTQDPTAQYTDRSVAVVFSYDRSECSASSQGLSTGAVIGIVIAIVALFAIIAIILILRFKGVIRPFADHEKTKQSPADDDDLDSANL
eukprot:TRINITY_DN4647_c0_g1_i1.p1 TRINITY_DN4647_c0_g1~~TRINITY_DN4647_c0_g1_i1.p1  ORF type:complete len:1194 (-),score=183.45 TRINITY_DN4647_c0_g1_i1:1-3558(-)